MIPPPLSAAPGLVPLNDDDIIVPHAIELQLEGRRSSPPPSRIVQVRCCAVSSVTRGGRARTRRGTSRKSDYPGQHADVRTHVDLSCSWVVGPCASFASPAPGRTRIGRDTHTRSTQRRRASPLRTPRRACTQRTKGARTHAEVRWGWWISALRTRRRVAREKRARVAAELVVVVQRGAPR